MDKSALKHLCRDCRFVFRQIVMVGYRENTTLICIYRREAYPRARQCGAFESKYKDEMDDNADCD